jgi:hypothetical protein
VAARTLGPGWSARARIQVRARRRIGEGDTGGRWRGGSSVWT